jgi:hypothetical protein
MIESVDMLGRLAGAAGIGTDRRVDDEDADIGVAKIELWKKPARKILNADAIGLAYGSERAFPNANPASMRHKHKVRAFRPQPSILLFDRQKGHGGQSPQGLLFGVGRAFAGTAAEPSAGILPLRRM